MEFQRPLDGHAIDVALLRWNSGMARKQYKRRWIDADGKIWAITKMDDPHLRHTIRMLIRWGNAAVNDKLESAFSYSVMVRGDGAQMAIDSEINVLMDTDGLEYAYENYKAFPRMLEVAEERKLTI